MLKNKLDFKLLNLCLVLLAIFLLYQTGSLWTGVISKVISIIAPFFLAFIIAYAFYPLLKWLIRHKIPKSLGVIIILILILSIIGLILGLGLPLIVNQLSSLFGGIISFFNELSNKFDVNFVEVQDTLTTTFNGILNDLSKYVKDGALNIIGLSLSYITIIMIALSSAIYLLIDMDKIRYNFKNFLLKLSNKLFMYVKRLDGEMKKYLTGLLKIIFITLFEYSISYLIIGHPNALLLGFLASIAVLVPYFGGIFVNIIAAITAFVISNALFIRTIICFVLLSWIDGYLINPLVYGKTNRIHPLIIIISVFACGLLFGIFGIVMALPISIIIVTTINYFKDDIKDIVEDKKRKVKLD